MEVQTPQFPLIENHSLHGLISQGESIRSHQKLTWIRKLGIPSVSLSFQQIMFPVPAVVFCSLERDDTCYSVYKVGCNWGPPFYALRMLHNIKPGLDMWYSGIYNSKLRISYACPMRFQYQIQLCLCNNWSLHWCFNLYTQLTEINHVSNDLLVSFSYHM